MLVTSKKGFLFVTFVEILIFLGNNQALNEKVQISQMYLNLKSLKAEKNKTLSLTFLYDIN